jgi:hypothetical protein
MVKLELVLCSLRGGLGSCQTFTTVNTCSVRLMIPFSLITIYCLLVVQAGIVSICIVLIYEEAWVRNILLRLATHVVFV